MSDIERMLDARPRDLGGFHVGRVLPATTRRFVGPFVFLDHMGPEDLDELDGFAVRPHPHMHLATVTYLFEGEITHRDSLGTKQVIQPGAINWMTAGRGIVHSERATAQRAKRVHGLQLWVGLPTKHEDVEPMFEHQPSDALPVVGGGGAHLRILAGTAFGKTSPVQSLSPLFYVEVRLAAGARLAVPTEYEDRAAYVIDGEVTSGAAKIEPRHMAVFERGTKPVLRATTESRLVLLGGEPLDGPRYMWWNFVSSSKDRIIEAAQTWRAGGFPVVPGDENERIPAPDGPRFVGGA
jgi:redox-sensitive bicupin YhaK (pirin superfamily)